jgi:hypothetical protein
MKWTVLFLSLIVISIGNIFICPVMAQTPPTLEGCPVFPADNVWNTPIDQLPVDPRSAAYIANIGQDRAVHPDFGSGLWEGVPIGIPYNVVPGTQPKVTISFEYEDESDSGPYPIPPDPEIEGGDDSTGDRHVVVLDKDNCLLYETWSTYPQPGGSWYAGSGAVFDLQSNTLRPSGWTSADAAGLPILPGLVRYDEVAAEEIHHAIRFTAPYTRRAYVWPARHCASNLTSLNYPPMGQRFRLKANFDISGFSPEVKVILTALKRYGMILADNGGAWFVTGVPDSRWDNDMLVSELGQVKGSDFEAVDESYLMIDPDSGQARQGDIDTQTPTVPTNLKATVISSTQIDLSWTASTDNVGVMGYRIYRNGKEIGTSPVPSYENTGLLPSTTYTYRIAAYDDTGNASAKSASAARTTQPSPSTKLSIGDHVQTIEKTGVRSTPLGSGTLLGTQPRGALGTVVGGPWYRDERWWWQIDYESDPEGWSAQRKLKKNP